MNNFHRKSKKSEISISSSCSDQIIISRSSTSINVVCTILGLKEGKECIVVGTLYKHMKFEPTILSEYSKESFVTPIVIPRNFVHLDDYLVLEDESGRVNLKGSVLSPSVYVTGNVVALHGKKLMLVIFWLKIFLKLNYHHNWIYQINQEQTSAAKIVQVVVAGNSVQIQHRLLNGQNLASKDQSKLFQPIKELDIFFTQIATAYNTFRSCTNPHLFGVDNVRFFGTSGQNIDDLEKYLEAKEKLEFMERTLR
ncbi:hypothetical protein L2E82_12294 [Cichorium intybus]|uniref:Uncharacterized protein n=1 Tax=Cichorium intybus TaxID=13427 RepID=A0ACB9GFP8_CICIN|nr:hypothetical protein L2E82_12294 [Cichorium intybus]